MVVVNTCRICILTHKFYPLPLETLSNDSQSHSHDLLKDLKFSHMAIEVVMVCGWDVIWTCTVPLYEEIELLIYTIQGLAVRTYLFLFSPPTLYPQSPSLSLSQLSWWREKKAGCWIICAREKGSSTAAYKSQLLKKEGEKGVGCEWQQDMEEAESLSARSVLCWTHKTHTTALTVFSSNDKKCLYSQENDE